MAEHPGILSAEPTMDDALASADRQIHRSHKRVGTPAAAAGALPAGVPQPPRRVRVRWLRAQPGWFHKAEIQGGYSPAELAVSQGAELDVLEDVAATLVRDYQAIIIGPALDLPEERNCTLYVAGSAGQLPSYVY